MDDMTEVKTQLATLTAAVVRMEGTMASYISLDKDMGIMRLQQTHFGEALTHVRERMEQNAVSCIRADEIIHKRVDDIVKDTTTFSSRATGGFYVVCAMGTVVVALCTWALAQITKNAEINIEQTQRLMSVERSVAELERRLTKGEGK